MNNKKIENVIKIVLIIIILLFSMIPAIYWGFNPELTKMQVFLKFWYVFVFEIAIGIVYLWLINKE